MPAFNAPPRNSYNRTAATLRAAGFAERLRPISPAQVALLAPYRTANPTAFAVIITGMGYPTLETVARGAYGDICTAIAEGMAL